MVVLVAQANKMRKNLIIAVDFDGTLSLNARWPEIGRPNLELFHYLIDERDMGSKIVLWTCREMDSGLQEAIEWCKSYGLEFDAVNENVSEITFYSRKVVADIYIDDLSLHPDQLKSQGYQINKFLKV